ncbi:methyltransferase [Corynebacterium liangguodongii]|uniref:O-methyltransferase C-terminal domain-containing protein n=1 Tax=Corynebacterium liangguodongii TaxID=2079535 RepID=A0A2S0WEW3_9CORY|nr:methyltransferase [Corynebacterium liangguodongii]AWB84290.1 hypothetical protein C3E79_07185 [Corynebacterium liangguodongii]PWB98583.1 hypothetical protein DF219_11160 [Corynebacterium liangguodongii]
MSAIDSELIYDAQQIIEHLDPLPGSVARIAVQEGLLSSKEPVSVAETQERLGIDKHSVRSFLAVLRDIGLITIAPGWDTYRTSGVGALFAEQSDPFGIQALFGDTPIATSFWNTDNILDTLRQSRENHRVSVDRWDSFDSSALAAQRAAFEAQPMVGQLPFMSDPFWEGVSTVLDLGGGIGLRSAALSALNPHLHITVQDIYPESESVEGIGYRQASFFEDVPTGYDAYLLCQILEDWTDKQVVTLLQEVRDSAGSDGIVAIASHEYSVFADGDYGVTALRLYNGMVAPARSREDVTTLCTSAGLTLIASHEYTEETNQRPYLNIYRT